MEAFATEHDIPFERCGKLVVALDASELERFEGLRERAEANGVPGLEVVGPERMREIEPHAAGIKALWSPTTGIIDLPARRPRHRRRGPSRAAARSTRPRAVTGITERGSEQVLATSRGDVVARDVIACAGLHADRLAAMTGDPGPRTDRPVPRRLLHADARRRSPRSRPDLPGARSALPVPRRPLHQAHRRRGVGGPERGARLRPRRLPAARPQPAAPGRRPEQPRLPAPRRAVLADGRGRDVARRLEERLPRRHAPLRPRDPRATRSCSGRRACAPRRSTRTGRSWTTSGSAARATCSTSATRRHRPRPRRSRSAVSWRTARTNASSWGAAGTAALTSRRADTVLPRPRRRFPSIARHASKSHEPEPTTDAGRPDPARSWPAGLRACANCSRDVHLA